MKRLLSLILCVLMAISLFPANAFAVDGESEPEASMTEVAETPAEDPPAEDPPAEDPPAEDPPAEDPPAEDPPAEDPPAEDPPAEDPLAEDPPVEVIPCTEPGCTLADGHEGAHAFGAEGVICTAYGCAVSGVHSEHQTDALCVKTPHCKLLNNHEGDCVLFTAEEQLTDAIAAGGSVSFDGDVTLSADLVIPAGVTLTLSGALMVPENVTLRNEGTLELNGTAEIGGVLDNADLGSIHIELDEDKYPDAPYAVRFLDASELLNQGEICTYSAVVFDQGAVFDYTEKAIEVYIGGSVTGTEHLSSNGPTRKGSGTVTVTADGDATTVAAGSTLQMYASETDVSWAVEAGTGAADIDSNGVLTGLLVGTVTVVAMLNSDESVWGSKEITVTPAMVEQIIIEASTENILYIGEESYPINYSVTPWAAEDQSVTWSIISGNTHATINADTGAVTGVSLGTVTVQLTANDGSGVTATVELRVCEKYTYPVVGGNLYYNDAGTIVDIDLEATSADIPAVIDDIPITGIAAFVGGGHLRHLTLPESLLSIGRYSFSSSLLTSVHIPAGVETIGDGAFCGSNTMTSITVAEENENFTGVNGVLYSKDMTRLICYPAGLTASSFTVPASVTCIGMSAFERCLWLKSVTMTNVEIICAIAFSGSGLTSVTIPASVTEFEIASNPFQECPDLLEISVAADNEYYCSVNGSLLSKDMTQLVAIPGGSSGSYAVPDGVTDIMGYSLAFSSATSVSIPASVERADLRYCTKVKSFTVDSENTAYSSRDGVVYDKAGEKLIAFPAARAGAFTVPDGVTEIGNEAFCFMSLSFLTFPASLETLQDGWLNGARNLRSIHFQGDADAVDAGALQGMQQESFAIYYSEEAAGWTTPVWNDIPCYPYEETTPVPVTEINLTTLSETNFVTIGDILVLSAEATGADGAVPTDPSVTWSVENGTGRAWISEDGLLTGLAAGTVTVIATANDGSEVTGTLLVTVDTAENVLRMAMAEPGTFFSMTENVLLTEDLTIPAGSGLSVTGGTLTVAEGVTLTNNGNLDVLDGGTLTVDGTYTAGEDASLKLQDTGRINGISASLVDRSTNVAAEAELRAALALSETYKSVYVLVRGTGVTLTEDLTAPENTTIYVGNASAPLTVASGVTLTIEGMLFWDISGILTVEDGGAVSVIGRFDRNYRITTEEELRAAAASAEDYTTVTADVSSASIVLTEDLTVPVKMSIIVSDWLAAAPVSLTVSSDVTLTVDGSIVLFENATLHNSEGGTVIVNGSIKESGGSVVNNGTLKKKPSSSDTITTYEELCYVIEQGYTSATITDSITLADDLTIPQGTSITLDVGTGITLTVPAGVTLTVNGELSLSSLSELRVNEGGAAVINGQFNRGEGSVVGEEYITVHTVTGERVATLEELITAIESGHEEITITATIGVSGTLTIPEDVFVGTSGTGVSLLVPAGVSLSVRGGLCIRSGDTLDVAGYLRNYMTVDVRDGATLLVSGSYTEASADATLICYPTTEVTGVERRFISLLGDSVATETALRAAFGETGYKTHPVQLTQGITLTDDLTVPEGIPLTTGAGLTVPAGVTLRVDGQWNAIGATTVAGTFVNNGEVIVAGTLAVTGTYTPGAEAVLKRSTADTITGVAEGSITLVRTVASFAELSAALQPTGYQMVNVILTQPVTLTGDLTVPANATLDTGNTLTVQGGHTLTVAGGLSLGDFGTLRIETDAVVTVTGTADLQGGTVENAGQCTFLHPVTGGSFTYTYEGVVIACDEAVTAAAIPASIDGISITEIGEAAFFGCQDLTQVTLPEGITALGDAAFAETALTAVVLPESLVSIGANAFDTAALTRVTIPAGVASIGAGAFSRNPALTSFQVAADNAAYCAVAGVLYNKNETTLVQYPGGIGGTVTVPDDVTAIAAAAFRGHTGLTSVTLPESVISVGSEAFLHCTALATVALPTTLRTVGTEAFGGCTALESISFPAGLTDIAQMAFYGDTALTRIVFRGNAPTVGEQAFEGIHADATVYYLDGTTGFTTPTWNGMSCSLFVFAESITVTGQDNAVTVPVDGTLQCSADVLPAGALQRDVTWSVADGTGSALIDQTGLLTGVTEGTVTVTATANDGSDVTGTLTVTVGESVLASGSCGENLTWTLDNDGLLTVSGTGAMTDYVEDGAPWMEPAEGFTTVVIEPGVTGVGNYAFYNCTELTSVTLPAGLQTIGSNAFYGCTGLPGVVLPDGLLTIGDCAFFSCSKLATAALPASLTSLGDNAFYNCRLTNVTVPGGVETIGVNAFGWCTQMVEATILPGVKNIGTHAFSGCENMMAVTIPAGVETIGEYAFFLNKILLEVVLPESLKTIGEYAFAGCDGLSSVTIPSGVTSLDVSAFSDCGSITDILVSETNTVYSGVDGFLCDKTGEVLYLCPGGKRGDIVIPDGVTLVKQGALMLNGGLIDIAIPAGVIEIEADAFGGFGVASFTVAEDNPMYSSVDGILCDKSGRTLIDYPTGRIGEIHIPNGVESIDPAAFTGFGESSGLKIPDSMTAIGNTFPGCMIPWVYIPRSVVSIASGAFGSSMVKRVYYAGTEAEFAAIECGEDAFPAEAEFFYETAAPSITWTLDDGVLTVSGSGPMPDYAPMQSPWYAAAQRGTITSVVVESGITGIGAYAFVDCQKLRTVSLPASVESIGAYAFYNCTSLTQVNIPAAVTDIGAYAFARCDLSAGITLPSGLTEIPDALFYGNSDLPSIVITNGVRTIGTDAFTDCTGLTAVAIPAGVSAIGMGAFRNCTGLTGITVAEGNTVYRSVDGVLYELSGGAPDALVVCPAGISGSVTVPDGVTNIYSDAFSGCKNLTTLNLPASLTYMEDYLFYTCPGLSAIHVNADNLTFASQDGVLFNKDGTMLLRYPAKKADRTYVIPDGVTTIDMGAFANCAYLEEITIADSLTIGSGDLFSGCERLSAILVAQTHPTLTAVDGVLFSKDMTTLLRYPPRKAGTAYTVPAATVTLASVAFEGCDSLTSLNLSMMDTTAVDGLGGTAALEEVSVAAQNLYFKSVDGVLFSKNGAVMYYYPPAKPGAVYRVPDGTRAIDLYGSQDGNDTYQMRVLIVPESVNTLWLPDDLAAGLDYVHVLGDAPTAGFGINIYDRTPTIYYEEGTVGWTTPSWNGCYCYPYLTVESITVTGQDNAVSVPVDGTLQCSADVLPAGALQRDVTWSVADGTGSALIDQTGLLTGVTEGAVTVTATANDGSGVTGTLVVVVGGSILAAGSCGENLTWTLDNDGLLTISGTGAMTDYAGDGAPWSAHRDRITAAVFENGITDISADAFADCSLLSAVTFPDTLRTVGQNAFSNTPLTDITLPEGLLTVGDYAFDTTGLSTVAIPESVMQIGAGAFGSDSALTSIHVAAGNTAYRSVSGVLYNKAGTTLVQYPGGIGGTVSIPAGVTTVGECAFYGNARITSVTLPAGLTDIQEKAFSGCIGLESIIIPATVHTVDEGAFRDAAALRSVLFLGTAPTLGAGAFDQCHADLVIHYPSGAFGWTTPTWNGYSCYPRNLAIAVTVSAQDNAISVSVGATLQLTADVLPFNVSDASVTWSIVAGGDCATIDRNGLLTAVSGGAATVRATVNDGTGVYGQKTVTILNYHAGDVAALRAFLEQEDGVGVKNGVKLNPAYDPDDPATYGNVTWDPDGRVTDLAWGTGGVQVNTPLGLMGTLDVSGCTSLVTLFCGGNNLTALDVSGCTGLWEVYGRFAGLSSLNVSGCTDLRLLDVTYNELTALDVTDNLRLEQLLCAHNRLTALDVTGNAELAVLECSNNQLAALDVTQNAALTVLDCESNELGALDVSGNAELLTLQCGSNMLAALDVSACVYLYDLGCGSNAIETLTLAEDNDLETLICSFNSLTALDLSGCTNLTTLNTYSNAFTELQAAFAAGEVTASSGQMERVRVDMSTHGYGQSTLTAGSHGTVGFIIVNSQVCFLATPDENYVFAGWFDQEDTLVSSASNAWLTERADVAYEARFRPAAGDILRATMGEDVAELRIAETGITLVNYSGESPLTDAQVVLTRGNGDPLVCDRVVVESESDAVTVTQDPDTPDTFTISSEMPVFTETLRITVYDADGTSQWYEVTVMDVEDRSPVNPYTERLVTFGGYWPDGAYPNMGMSGASVTGDPEDYLDSSNPETFYLMEDQGTDVPPEQQYRFLYDNVASVNYTLYENGEPAVQLTPVHDTALQAYGVTVTYDRLLTKAHHYSILATVTFDDGSTAYCTYYCTMRLTSMDEANSHVVPTPEELTEQGLTLQQYIDSLPDPTNPGGIGLNVWLATEYEDEHGDFQPYIYELDAPLVLKRPMMFGSGTVRGSVVVQPGMYVNLTGLKILSPTPGTGTGLTIGNGAGASLSNETTVSGFATGILTQGSGSVMLYQNVIVQNCTVGLECNSGSFNAEQSSFLNNATALKLGYLPLSAYYSTALTLRNMTFLDNTVLAQLTDGDRVLDLRYCYLGEAFDPDTQVINQNGLPSTDVNFAPYYLNQTRTELCAAGISADAGTATLEIANAFNAPVEATVFDVLEQDDASTLNVTIVDEAATEQVSWSFDANAPTGKTVDAVNFQVTATPDAAAQEIIDTSVTEEPYQAVNFAHAGDLPYAATVTVPVTETLPEGNLALYYANTEAGTLDYAGDVTRNDDGTATIGIDHCSVYVITRKLSTGDSVTVTARDNATVVAVRGTLQMSAAVEAESGRQTVTWSVTDDTGRAVIDQNGLLTGVSAGTVTVTATATEEGVGSGSMTVTVEEEQTLSYKVVGGWLSYNTVTGVITAADATVTTAVIPASIGGVEITAIGDNAFKDHTALTSVTLPQGLRSIGSSAFSGCLALVSANLPTSVTTIGSQAFAGCGQLSGHLTIPSGVMEIRDSAFSGCTRLTGLTLPTGMAKIGAHAFESCSGITRLTLPLGLLEIGADAFAFCSGIEGTIAIPHSVATLGAGAFSACDKLTGATLPRNMTALPAETFADCAKLRSVTFPAGLLTVGDSAFARCALLANVDIPSGVTDIGASAFGGCAALTALVIPEDLNVIQEGAFAGCTGLTDVVFPAELTEIGASAFNGCTALGTATFTGDAPATFGTSVFDGCKTGFRIRYSPDTTGWTTPTWNGYPSAMYVAATSITVTSPNDVSTVHKGETLQLSATLAPETTTVTVVWSVTNGTGTATITDEGVLTATGAGTVTVRATANDGSGVYGEKTVTVTPLPVSGITVSAPAGTVVKGETLQLSAEVLPANADNKTYTWSVTNGTGTATITDEGELTATGAGTVTVYATANDGSGVSGQLAVTITDSYVVTIDLAGIENAPREIWIDGVKYSGAQLTQSGTQYSVALTNGTATNAVVYSYNSLSQSDPHRVYPTGMTVWLLRYENDRYTASRAPAFDDILEYAGCSIRIAGKKGIRMITSLTAGTKAALTGGGINGYKLVEYGTVVAWASELGGAPLVLGPKPVKSAFAYKRGVADPVYRKTNDTVQYTNVLVDFSNTQCVPDLAMRPYIKLENAAGEQLTLYGGVILRSIGYIAWQNRTAFPAQSAAGEYIKGIIDYVTAHGAQYE